MALDLVARQGLVLVGCGKMGSAMLAGWLAAGIPPGVVTVIEPRPSDWLSEQGVRLNADLPEAPAVVVVAVKPQIMAEALPGIARLGGGPSLILTVAAGIPLAAYEAAFGAGTPVVRAMPNTPAAIGQGVTALIGNGHSSPADLALATALMATVGQVVHLESEAQMDAVTALSGSGPAYVFHLVEAMAQAGITLGLAPDLALQLARGTVSGAGALIAASAEGPDVLRQNVTSPGGTTAAALGPLMAGLAPLMTTAMAAAAARSKELSGG